MIIFVSHRFHWFSQIFPSGPLDYSSAEFKRNLNGYHLAHGYYFIAHGSHSHRFFPPDHLFFEHESNEICRRPTDQREVIFFIRTIGLFIRTVNPCPSVCQKTFAYSSNSCSKKIRVHPVSVGEKIIIRVEEILCGFFFLILFVILSLFRCNPLIYRYITDW